MLGLISVLESSCLPGQLRYIIHFLHAFDSDAVDLPLRPIANRFGGCFCLGSGPVFCVLVCFRLFASLFPLAKRKSGWGICGSSFVVCLWFPFCCYIDLLILRTFLSLYSVLTAYSHVRTEPQCDIGQTRGKKIKGVLSPHSRTASASEGTRLGSWYWTSLFLRV